MAEADLELDEDLEIGVEDLDEEIEDEIEEEVQPDPEPPRKGRAAQEIVKLRKRAQTAETENQRLREDFARTSGRVESLERTITAPTAESQRQERERLDAMTPEERVEYRLSQEKREIQGAFAHQSFRFEDTTDQLMFDRVCEKNPAYAAVADEVERRLKELRNGGSNVARKVLANNIIGERAAERAVRPQKKVAKQVQTGRSDVPPERPGRKAKTAKDRLNDVTF